MATPLQLIQAKLEAFQGLTLSLPAEPITDYISLRQAVIRAEMIEAVEKLSALMTSAAGQLEQFQAGFLALCAERSRSNQGKALSFSALPDGDTNVLYANITRILFQPTNLYELLSILSPETQSVIVFQLETEQLPPSVYPGEAAGFMRELKVLPAPAPISILASQAIPQDFSEIVFCDEYCFQVSELQRLNFSRQIHFYAAIAEQYPDLAERLYTHNATLSTLKQDIRLFINQGETLKDALEALRKGLVLGGEKMTGGDYAGGAAVSAWFNFKQKVNHPDILPILFQLSTGSNSFEEVWKSLEKGDCVEAAATSIGSILSNKANQHLLSFMPGLAPSVRQSVLTKYTGAARRVLYYREDNTIALPAALSEQVLSEIQIGSSEEFILLLTQFPEPIINPLVVSLIQRFDTRLSRALPEAPLPLHPENTASLEKFLVTLSPEEKIGLLKKISVTLLGRIHFGEHHARFNVLSDAITHEFLTDEQLMHLTLGLIQFFDLALIIRIALSFAVKADNPLLLGEFFTPLPEALKGPLSQMAIDRGRTLLHEAKDSPQHLVEILEAIEPTERLALVMMKETDCDDTVLHHCLHKPQCIEAIVSRLPLPERLIAMTATNIYNEPVIHWISGNFASIQTAFSLLPPESRVDALFITDNWNHQTLIERILLNKARPEYQDTYEMICSQLSDEECVHVLTLRSSRGIKLFDAAISDKGNIRSLVNSLSSESGLFNALQLTSNDESTTLWQVILSGTHAEVTGILRDSPTHLATLLLSISEINALQAGPGFFMVGSPATKIDISALLTLGSVDELYQHMSDYFSSVPFDDYKQMLLNKLVSNYTGETDSTYEEKLSVLLTSWGEAFESCGKAMEM